LRPFGPRCALFDLDNTLYPRSAGLGRYVGERIQQYMAEIMGLDSDTITGLRGEYMQRYGTSMRGLLLHHGIDPDEFLDYVHDLPVSEMLSGNDELGRVLASLPWNRVVFTNASAEHARRVLEALAVSGHFSRVFDVRSTGYIGKPDPRAYQIVLDALGLQGGDCILFDDSLPNLQAAVRLGMLTVLVGSRDRTDGVDWAIERIENAADVAADILPGLSLIAG